MSSLVRIGKNIYNIRYIRMITPEKKIMDDKEYLCLHYNEWSNNNSYHRFYKDDDGYDDVKALYDSISNYSKPPTKMWSMDFPGE